MLNTPVNNILPSITNAYGDPCINPNFGNISIKVQNKYKVKLLLMLMLMMRMNRMKMIMMKENMI